MRRAVGTAPPSGQRRTSPSRGIFYLFSTNEEVLADSLLCKDLLLRTCSTLLWEGERCGKRSR
jgi:hypothetical protein